MNFKTKIGRLQLLLRAKMAELPDVKIVDPVKSCDLARWFIADHARSVDRY